MLTSILITLGIVLLLYWANHSKDKPYYCPECGNDISELDRRHPRSDGVLVCQRCQNWNTYRYGPKLIDVDQDDLHLND